MEYISNELDSWLDEDYLISVADEIVNLDDFVPNTIELHLPNYESRKQNVLNNHKLIESDEFQYKQVLDQMGMGATWEEHVSVYDDFFKRHPEFSGLIKDKKAYENWRLEEVPY